MAYKNTLITGITDFLVLAILKSKGDCYAYEISKYITSESNELLSISPNTIYTVMYKLENEQMISEYSVLVGKKRTRIYYHIESDGEAYLKELQHDYENMISVCLQFLILLRKETLRIAYVNNTFLEVKSLLPAIGKSEKNYLAL